MTQKSAVIKFKQILEINQSAVQDEPGSNNLQLKTNRAQPICNSRGTRKRVSGPKRVERVATLAYN